MSFYLQIPTLAKVSSFLRSQAVPLCQIYRLRKDTHAHHVASSDHRLIYNSPVDGSQTYSAPLALMGERESVGRSIKLDWIIGVARDRSEHD